MSESRNTTALSRRSFLAKSALAAGAITGAGALLDACGSSSTSAGGKTTLNVMHNSSELTPAYIADFEKLNPNITIKFTTYDATRLAASIAAGNPPDFVRGNGVTDSPNLAARGLMEPLDAYLASSKVLKVSDLEPINDVWRYDSNTHTQGTGPRYGLVRDYSYDFMYWYDKRQFDRAGIQHPDPTTPMTYEDLLTLAQKLTVRQGGKIQVYGMDWSPFSFGITHLMQMVAQQGASIFNSDLTKVDFTKPEIKAVMDYWLRVAQAHVAPSPLDPSSDWGWPLLQAERIGVVQYGYFFGGLILTDTKGLPDHVGFAPAPIFTSGPGGKSGATRVSTSAAGTGAWIPSSAKNKDAAWKLMEYFMAGKPALNDAQSGWGLPSLTTYANDLPQAQPFQKQAYTTVQAEKPYFKVINNSPYAAADALTSAVSTGFQSALTGQMSLDATLAQITSTCNLLLSQGQEQVG